MPGEYTSYDYTDPLTAEDLVRLLDWLEADVRKFSHIPYPEASSGVRYEHSMGQGSIPEHLLRSSFNQLQYVIVFFSLFRTFYFPASLPTQTEFLYKPLRPR